MRFKPMSEEDIQAMNLLPPGVYQFEVIDAVEKKDKNNKEFMALILKVWDNDGRERKVFSNLFTERLLRHFCVSTNMIEKYEMGVINPIDCLGKSGCAEFGIEKDKTGKWPDKNSVIDFITKDSFRAINNAATEAPIKKANEFDDDLPF